MNIAVITGASSGLGKEFAKQLSTKYKGIDEIWLIARREEKLIALRETLDLPCRILPYDITERKWFEVYEQLLEELNPNICVLINNAGYGKIGAFEEIDLQDQMGMIDLNIKSLVKMTYMSLSYLRPKAKIIQVASSAGFLPQPYFNIYAATKAFVLSFSRALHYELKKDHITVTAVCPGPVKTEFFDVASSDGEPSLVIKKFMMTKPNQVVHKAFIDASKGKDVSIYGKSMNVLIGFSKIVPHKWILPFIKY